MDDRVLAREQARLLRRAIEHAGLELVEVWVRYFSLGGIAEQFELEAYLHHALILLPLERDVLAHAVNELIDLREIFYAPYAYDLTGPDLPDHFPADASIQDASSEQEEQDPTETDTA